MIFASLIDRLRRYDTRGAIIFDRDEPIGRPTDLVMPRRRWIGRKPAAGSVEARVQAQWKR